MQQCDLHVHLELQGFIESFDGMFGSTIRRALGETEQAGDGRSDADVRGAVPFSGRIQGFCQVDGREEIDLHHAAVHVFGGFDGAGTLGDSGVEDQIVEPAFQ